MNWLATQGRQLGNTNQTDAPTALNANTTYGMDVSMQNNYGVGKSYSTASQSRSQARSKKAEPSAWWLGGILLLLAVL